MKQAFLIAGLISLIMYIAAQTSLIKPKEDSTIHITWGTDPNPARTAQTTLFNKTYPGIALTVDPQDGDITKLLVRCVTDSGPDIIDLQQNTMNSLVGAGILLDLTPYAKQMGFDSSQTYSAIKDSLEIEGKQYRFPCNVTVDAVIYNKKIFDDHGVSYPPPDWNYDDFVRISKELIEKPSKSGEKHLAVANWSNVAFFKDLMAGTGSNIFSSDGLHCILNSREAIQALQQYYDLIYKYHVISTPADSSAISSQGGWGSGALNWFNEGKAAMIFVGRWYIVQVPNYPNLKGALGSIVVPRLKDHPSSSIAVSRAAGINAKSKHRDAALKFLQFLASPEYSRMIVEDGDSLPPNPEVAVSGNALANESVPDPAFHDSFLKAVKNARVLNSSPYIDDITVSRWMQEFVDKTDNQILTPAQALQTLTVQLDKQIRINLERQPNLQKRYEESTGKHYSPNWK